MSKGCDRRAIPLAAQEEYWAAPDGQRVRTVTWPDPPGPFKGSLLFLPGRGDFLEKYIETLDHWHLLGWRVRAADWRGQGASGRLGNDAVTGHIDDFSIWVDDLAGLWRDWTARGEGPHVLVGHSMGGHLMLRACAEGRVDPAGLILIAPMMGLAGDVLPGWLMQLLMRIMAALRGSRRPAWKWTEKPGEPDIGRIDLLTHDAARYADELWWRESRPELAMGPGSLGWVRAAYASMRAALAPGIIERVKAPVLLLASDADKLVSFAAIMRTARRLQDCQLVHFGQEARHEILREADPVRDRALAACDAFLERIAAEAAR